MIRKIFVAGWLSVLTVAVLAIWYIKPFRVRPTQPDIQTFIAALPVANSDYPYVWDTTLTQWDFAYKPYEYRKGQFVVSNLKLGLTEALYEEIDLDDSSLLGAGFFSDLVGPAAELKRHLEQKHELEEVPTLSDDLRDHVILRGVARPGDSSVMVTASGEAIWGEPIDYQQPPSLSELPPPGTTTGARWIFHDRSDETEGVEEISGDAITQILQGLFKHGEGKQISKIKLNSLSLQRTRTPLDQSENRSAGQGLIPFDSLKLWNGETRDTVVANSTKTLPPIDLSLGTRSVTRLDQYQEAVHQWRQALFEAAQQRKVVMDQKIGSKLEAAERLRTLLMSRIAKPGYIILSAANDDSGDDLLLHPLSEKPEEETWRIVRLGKDFASAEYKFTIGAAAQFDPEIARLKETQTELDERISHLTKPEAATLMQARLSSPATVKEPVVWNRLSTGRTSSLPDTLILRGATDAIETLVSVNQTYRLNLEEPKDEIQEARLAEAKQNIDSVITVTATELEALEGRRQNLLGPIEVRALLEGELKPRRGTGEQPVLMQVIDLSEAAQEDGRFALTVAVREPDSLEHISVVAGEIDLSSDTAGIVRRYLEVQRRLNRLHESEAQITDFIGGKAEQALVFDENEFPPWNPAEAQFPVKLRSRRALQIGQALVTSPQDPRLLLRIEGETVLEGESVASEVALKPMSVALAEAYAKALSAIAAVVEGQELWISQDRSVTMEMSAIEPEVELLSMQVALFDRGMGGAPSFFQGRAGPVIANDNAVQKQLFLRPTGSGNQTATSLNFAVEDRKLTGIGDHALHLTPAPGMLLALHQNQHPRTIYRDSGQLNLTELAIGLEVEGFTSGLGALAKTVAGIGAAALAVEGENSALGTSGLAAGGLLIAVDEAEKEKRLEAAETEAQQINSEYDWIGLRGEALIWAKLDTKVESIFFGRGAIKIEPRLYRIRKRGRNFEIMDQVDVGPSRTWTSQVVELKLPSNLEPGFYVISTAPKVVGGTVFPLEITAPTEIP